MARGKEEHDDEHSPYMPGTAPAAMWERPRVVTPADVAVLESLDEEGSYEQQLPGAPQGAMQSHQLESDEELPDGEGTPGGSAHIEGHRLH